MEEDPAAARTAPIETAAAEAAETSRVATRKAAMASLHKNQGTASQENSKGNIRENIGIRAAGTRAVRAMAARRQPRCRP